jgi:hypothetical protein
MKNKTISQLVESHGDKIATWYKDSDGYWLTLQYGWQATPHSLVHTLHESTVAEIKKSFRNVVPCNCLSCKTFGKFWMDYDMYTDKMVIRKGRQEDAK